MKHRALVHVLKILTKQVLQRYQPTVVGITGSVGKTSTKEAVYTVLSRNFFVGRNSANTNNEIGIPCAVMGIEPSGTRDRPATFRSRLRFLSGIAKGVWLAYGLRRKSFPRILVLELGADRPGDMAYLTEIVRPRVAVLTAIGSVPVHVEFYENPEAVAREKAEILRYVDAKGIAILNGEDPVVLAMKSKIRSPVLTFGFRDAFDLWASDLAYYMNDDQAHIEGLSFKIHKGTSFVPIRVPGLVAPHQLSSIMAAAAVGMYFGMNLVEVGSALELYESPMKRVELFPGVKKSMILDDTYNASPLSTQAALETLHEFGTTLRQLHARAGRRIAVLGDMKELGDYAEEAHKEIGIVAAGKCDYLITVGELGKLIADAAISKMPNGRVQSYPDTAQALAYVKKIIKSGDVVLIKGSYAMHMGTIVDGLRAKL